MMGVVLIKAVIFAGCAIMLLNIILYIRFERSFTRQWGWEGAMGSLYFPIILLILFLLGYLAVGFAGTPSPVVAGILFGGSVFVLAMLQLLRKLADRIRQTEELRIELQAAEQASAAKSVFLSNMSHDIRTPLNAIIGYARLAEEEGVSEEALREYVAKIGISGKQLMELINDVLEMSRIENGRIQLSEAPEDLVRIVEDMHAIFDDHMAAKGLEFSIDTKNVRNRVVLCDRMKINRILINLLSNAYKFTPEGGSVQVLLQQTGEETEALPKAGQPLSYRLTVKDSGIGMAPEFVEHVFEAFERERTSTVSGTQGTGLGMAITKIFVDLMGGTIQVESRENEGTQFTIDLDLKAADSAPEEEKAGSPDEDCGCAKGRRLLLADDVEINREIAVRILEHMGFCVDTAANGAEALRMVETAGAGYYDAVLMDIQMPLMDGYEATRKIRELNDPALAAIPIIAVTANAFEEDRKQSELAGMDGHVAKPLEPAELKAVLSQAIPRTGTR